MPFFLFHLEIASPGLGHVHPVIVIGRSQNGGRIGTMGGAAAEVMA